MAGKLTAANATHRLICHHVCRWTKIYAMPCHVLFVLVASIGCPFFLGPVAFGPHAAREGVQRTLFRAFRGLERPVFSLKNGVFSTLNELYTIRNALHR
ncbi:hypothetical protein [Pseudomonas aeruginosa]|uniref:hypothetical protein n=1 Tax=Pseudomonas aeruginosa TaxID=287 RepID=UPI003D9CB0C9